MPPGEQLEKNLPKNIFNAMKRELQFYYPAHNPCDNKEYCWRYYGDVRFKSPARLYEFSADSRKLEPDNSREVGHIYFYDLHSFRLGAINNLQYNYYGMDIERSTFPFFVRYIFPKQAEGAQLCFIGNLIIQDKDKNYTNYQHVDNKCLYIDNKLIDNPLFLYSFNSETLLAVETRGHIKINYIFKSYVLFILQLLALFILLQFNRSTFINKYVVALLLAIPFNYLYYMYKRMGLWPANFIIYEGGDDGLTHDGKGRLIIQNIYRVIG